MAEAAASRISRWKRTVAPAVPFPAAARAVAVTLMLRPLRACAMSDAPLLLWMNTKTCRCAKPSSSLDGRPAV